MTEHDLFADSVRRALADGGPADARLADIGWTDALTEWGGPAISIVFEALGEVCGTGSALDDVMTQALGVDPEVYGAGAVVLPAPGRTTPAGTIADSTLDVAGVASARVAAGAPVLVVAADADSTYRTVVVPTSEMELTAIDGIDPNGGLWAVSATGVAALTAQAPVDWERVKAVAQVAIACELVGLSRGMLDLAIEHARSRVQFGRPIASFQAVRHRLVEAHLAIEAAHAATTACTDAIGPDLSAPDLPPAHALMAKALAGTGARTAARHCQQVLAGVGFTAEHRFHHYFRRVLVLDRLLGSAKSLTREVGSITIAQRSAPFQLPL